MNLKTSGTSPDEVDVRELTPDPGIADMSDAAGRDGFIILFTGVHVDELNLTDTLEQVEVLRGKGPEDPEAYVPGFLPVFGPCGGVSLPCPPALEYCPAEERHALAAVFSYSFSYGL